MKFIALLILFTLKFTYSSQAQVGFYIPANGDIMAYGSDTLAIFSDLQNFGRFGSTAGAVINFYGKTWTNAEVSLLPDEHYYNNAQTGIGGTFRFTQDNGGNIAQFIYGGYNATSKVGASFPNININNRNSISLSDLSDLKIRRKLHFENGLFFLNGWNLVVGDGSPGIITGYSENAFIVTGHDVGGGFLYREHISQNEKQVVFPIGTDQSSYTPLRISNRSATPGYYRARAFNNVYDGAISGRTNDTLKVRKTWNIGNEASGGANDISVEFQHNQEEEGTLFAQNRDSSFISSFVTNTGWDTIPPSAVLTPGTITDKSPIANAYINKRDLTGLAGNNFYFSVITKYKLLSPSSSVKLIFNAFRDNIRWVTANWKTTEEKNILRYELQRRRENEFAFYSVAVIPTNTPSGNSTTDQHYFQTDDNLYDNWSYYRLKIFGKDDLIYYSDIRKVPNAYKITISPNPNNGVFRVDLFGIRNTLKMDIYNIAGQLNKTYLITQSTTISGVNLPAGLYIIVFTDLRENVILDRQKIEIINY